MAFGPETDQKNPVEPAAASRPRGCGWIVVVLVVLAAVGGYVYWSRAPGASPEAGAQGKKSMGSVPVVAAVAKKGDVGIYVTGIGSVVPIHTVTIKSRVDGQLMKVNFQEGQIVKEGDFLAEIDPRPYQAQLAQAEGQLVKDQALLENARRDVERYKALAAQDSIAKQQFDTQKSLVLQYQGAIQIDQGQVDNAKLQVTYSHICAPVSGRIGLRTVDAGNMIHASDATGLAVITQLQPITVVFPIAEDNLPDILARMEDGERLPVLA